MAARSSPLSRAQVSEIESLMSLQFTCIWVETSGDRDRTTSLRDLGTTDFFTREVDALLFEGKCDATIHSAKDLPNPLDSQLTLAALTSGVDPSDVLVLRPGESLEKGMVIATSSVRREEAVSQLCKPLIFRDVRGTIYERLALLEQGETDGVVVAKAALIRLGLLDLRGRPGITFTIPEEKNVSDFENFSEGGMPHTLEEKSSEDESIFPSEIVKVISGRPLNWIPLPGETVPLQGQLAILCRAEDSVHQKLFAQIDTGNRR